VAVDVGYGQLAWELRQDPRVLVLERTNARYLTEEQIRGPVEAAVTDVSFISLTLLLPAILPLITPGGWLTALIKPQFEVGKGQVGKGGVVRDPELRARAVEKIVDFLTQAGAKVLGTCPSPIKGPKGNQEFLVGAKV
jgi:23S rRNA (cytidine1920-2'-O)/16S rRNA (cytidine1409-2'-O)-methyltransferase